MEEIYEFLKECEYYFLATVEGDQPRVRPFMSLTLFENKLYILTTNDKNVYEQMTKNPKVELCGYDGEEWIRVTAEVREEDNIEAKKEIIEDYSKLDELYDADDENVVTFSLEKVKAHICSFDHEPMEVII